MGVLYLNGAFLDEDIALIDPADRGFTLGDGVFDTLLVQDGEPVDADLHFERLARHAAVLDIRLPNALRPLVVALIGKNKAEKGRWALRTTLTRGAATRGLLPSDKGEEPTLMIRLVPASPPAPGPRLVIARSVRRNEGSPLSRIKALGYGDSIMALMEACKREADDALILNNAGFLCCASAANVFVRIDGEWLTPPLEDGVLDGVTRSKIIAAVLAREERIKVITLERAEAIALTNSLTGVRLGASLEGRTLALDNALSF